MPPRTLECLASSRNRDVDILFCGFMYRANHLFIGRVDGLEGLAVDALNEFIVDEPIFVLMQRLMGSHVDAG